MHKASLKKRMASERGKGDSEQEAKQKCAREKMTRSLSITFAERSMKDLRSMYILWS